LALATLSRRVAGRAAAIEIVDMRAEIQAGRRGALSQAFVRDADRAIAAGEQVILFLNRRGASTFVLCRECGQSVQCPRCSVSLVQHPELGGLACHYCDTVEPMPERCPNCGSPHIRGLGLGTQRLETIVSSLWPDAGVVRLDRDSVRRQEAYHEILDAFVSGRAQILVGTQLVARGLDLPTVTMVGVVDADLPLHFPDYRSAESTFALITQVAGRAGRSERPATVIVQTSNPEHYSLLAAQRGDYRAFYDQEIVARRLFEFPPAAELAVLTFSDPDPERAASESKSAGEWLQSVLDGGTLPGIRLLGPTPPFLHRLRGDYRWQLTLKGHDLARVRPHLPRGRGWSYDVDPFS
ncbi:MAG: primosomal protein N', partial [Candidatus Dormiibacterota bacterium]